MKVKKLIQRIDRILQGYLGLESEETQPTSVKLKGDQLIVIHIAPYKRHMIKEPWETFIRSNLAHTSLETRRRLGLAAGKALAKNLVISFEEILIKKEVANVKKPNH